MGLKLIRAVEVIEFEQDFADIVEASFNQPYIFCKENGQRTALDSVVVQQRIQGRRIHRYEHGYCKDDVILALDPEMQRLLGMYQEVWDGMELSIDYKNKEIQNLNHRLKLKTEIVDKLAQELHRVKSMSFFDRLKFLFTGGYSE